MRLNKCLRLASQCRNVNLKSLFHTSNVNLKINSHTSNIRCVQQFDFSKMSTKASPTQTKKESFEDVLPSILNTITTNNEFAEVPEVADWVKKVTYWGWMSSMGPGELVEIGGRMNSERYLEVLKDVMLPSVRVAYPEGQIYLVLEYNLAGGKKARGLTTLFAYEMLEKPENITEETIYLAKTLGWCVEILQGYLIMLDDIMDGSTTRRGVPCWYQLPEVGLAAVNDSSLMFSSIFYVLRAHFADKKTYTNLVELFNESLMHTSIGQHLDVTMERRQKSDYSLFTIERYNAIVKYKTAYYTYQLPICLGMLLANISDPVLHQKAEDICLEIGKFFQIQDDYIDCYGDESLTGKMGTDIQEAKCSWLAVMALQRCSASQKIVFTTCYGSKEPAHVERIKELYKQLQLPELYAQEETRMYESLIKQAHALPSELSPALFVRLIHMIYKRNH